MTVFLVRIVRTAEEQRFIAVDTDGRAESDPFHRRIDTCESSGFINKHSLPYGILAVIEKPASVRLSVLCFF